MNQPPDTKDHAPLDLNRGGRSFLVEYQPPPLETGWLLRERHHDGWPALVGPFDTRDAAIEHIDDLIAAGPLCCYEDEHGYQSCWI